VTSIARAAAREAVFAGFQSPFAQGAMTFSSGAKELVGVSKTDLVVPLAGAAWLQKVALSR